MADVKVGDLIINDAGTCLRVVDQVEGASVKPGTAPAQNIQAYLDAGYALVDDETEIPRQSDPIPD